MSYVALYRKYRPLKFDEMVGQNHITDILKNQINTAKISHAYIFSGTRGTGKTSAAKIFARAINCLNLKNGEPCNECEACKSILNNETTDVVEMDAASNNSVDNIRSVRQEVMYSTTNLKYRVYIIDEAHMLSTSAFNALLKTLEEPPENVVFILATTEEYKIIPTILSRCVRFEFKKITEKDIFSKLSEILNKDNIPYEEEALRFIASISDGAMRDALSILERCISSNKEKITYNIVNELVGSVDQEILERLAEGIIEYNFKISDQAIDDIISKGKNLRNVVNGLLNIFMNILILKESKLNKQLSSKIELLKDNISSQRIGLVIKELSALDESLRNSNTPTVFKAKMLELTIGSKEYDDKNIDDKIKALELKIEKIEQRLSKNMVFESDNKKKKEETEITTKLKQTEEVENNRKTLKNKLKDFDKILDKTKDSDNFQLYSALADTLAYEEDNKIIFETKNSFAQSVLRKEASKKELEAIVEEIYGESKRINIEYFTPLKEKIENGFEDAMSDSGVPFTVID